ncbi:IucA/IucC family protein [Nocardiopsis chromatogenes]|uniref:IucA/IucC family protein n=1 Tax=Nocardiopsis chromatogenes TaxID=280239 RepID=UPI000347B590|nr:IucA/IucC family protein [Nocardiopsis chromatogenes]
MTCPDPAELVLRDLVDTVLREGLSPGAGAPDPAVSAAGGDRRYTDTPIDPVVREVPIPEAAPDPAPGPATTHADATPPTTADNGTRRYRGTAIDPVVPNGTAPATKVEEDAAPSPVPDLAPAPGTAGAPAPGVSPAPDAALADGGRAPHRSGAGEDAPPGQADALAASPVPGVDLAPGEAWCRLGGLAFRVRDGGALQRLRLSRGPVWLVGAPGPPRPLAPDEALRALADGPAAADAAADLRDAVAHARVVLRGARALPHRAPRPGGLLAGERLAATRNRPFHPTARAVSGWSAADVARYGPMRAEPLGVHWAAVRSDHLRFGSGPGSGDPAAALLDDDGREALRSLARRAGADDGAYTAVPVHPWQWDHVLPTEFARELADRTIVPLGQGVGRFHPTSSLRTLAAAPEPGPHLKLPVGAATLAAARLLPPRYLDNGERAQSCMEHLLRTDPALAALVEVCDERTWCGWSAPGADDAFADRPGHLAAQVRRYPPGLFADPDALVLPMGALAAHDWDVLGPALSAAGFDPGDPVGLFRTLAEAFCAMGLAFLGHGVLPELHGQNTVAVLADGRVRRFVLRDHDTLRLCPELMAAAGTPDPGYRVKPGAPQSLSLDRPEELLGYLQTLGFQVNLYGIADALARHSGTDERVLWGGLGAAVASCLGRLDLPEPVAALVEERVLRAWEWPHRRVLGPLLRRGRSAGVSMPADTGRVPNPLGAVPAAVR